MKNKKICLLNQKGSKYVIFTWIFNFRPKKYSQGTCRRAKPPGGPCFEKPLNAPNTGLYSRKILENQDLHIIHYLQIQKLQKFGQLRTSKSTLLDGYPFLVYFAVLQRPLGSTQQHFFGLKFEIYVKITYFEHFLFYENFLFISHFLDFIQ